ncbi:MAG: low specificity L-threonine aldolase [Verrucomicrobia bacterium]|nr:low specificity L-threonine aldolase [Verrucomicrobiota bacterium]MCH8510445.1 low specificity L-threonine aldolase [Kiritimatiellia bacterium]
MHSHYAFASDNTAGMCPEALEALCAANEGLVASYGDDPWTSAASDAFRDLFETHCDVYFVCTGTAANSLALASLCASYHSVIAHELAHIETDECGAPEFFSNGSKLLMGAGEQGKLHPESVKNLVTRRTDIHYPKPKALSISQSTEAGTVYRPDEIGALGEIARGHQLKIHMDGARFANAVASLGVSPAEVTWKAGVDVLCFSGTKNGLGMGEAVIFFDRALSEEFAYRCKQAGQLVSKMRYLSAPWLGLLSNDVWLKNARHANKMATQLRSSLAAIEGVRFAQPTEANGVFVCLPESVILGLRERGWKFYTFIGQGFARFMCSWKTREEDVERLVADVEALAGGSL